jgi:hypothetical protein
MLVLLKNAFDRIGMLPNRFGQPSTAGARIKVLRVEYIIDFANITKKTENELTKLNLKNYI